MGKTVAVLEIRGRICYRTSASWWTSICLMNTSVPLPRFGRFHFEGSFLHRRFSWISWVQKRPAPEREAPLPAFGEDSNLAPIREEFLLFLFNVIQRRSKFCFHSRPLDEHLTICACARLRHKFQQSFQPDRNPKKKRPLRVFANGLASRIGNDLSYVFRLIGLREIQRLKTAVRSH